MEPRNWFIIESGSKLDGPFTLAEVKAKFPHLPKRSMIVCDGKEPFYVNDLERMAEILKTGFAGIQSRVTRSGVQRLASDPFAEASHYTISTSEDLRASSARITSHSQAKEPGWFERVARAVLGGPRKRRRKRGMIRIRRQRLPLLLLPFVLLPANDLTNLSEMDSDMPPTSQLSMSAKVLAPTSLRALDTMIAAKLGRDRDLYVRALLSIETVRHFFAPEQLPSPAFSAALAMSVMPGSELDKNPNWRRLLERLGRQPQQEIAVVGYEAARIDSYYQALLDSALRNGVAVNRTRMSGKPVGVTAYWSVMERDDGVVMDAALMSEISLSIKRMEGVFDAVPARDGILRNRLGAEAVWRAATLAWLASKDISDEKLGEFLQRLSALSRRLSLPDKELLQYVIDEYLWLQAAPRFSAREFAQSRIDHAWKVHKETGFLCNPREGAMGPEFLVSSLRMAKIYGAHIPSVAPLFNRCFVGSFEFVPLERVSAVEPGRTPMAMFLPSELFAVQKSELLLERLQSGGADAVFDNTGLTSSGAMRIWAAVTGLWGELPSIDEKQLKNRCATGSLSRKTCLNLQWHYARSGQERLVLLDEVKRNYSPEDVRQLALALAADVRTGRLPASEGSSFNPKILEKVERGAMRFLDDESSDVEALEWYINNHEVLVK